MHRPMPPLRQSKPMAFALVLMLAGTAHGAGLSLRASGESAYLCTTVVERAHGAPVESNPARQRVDSHEATTLHIGDLPPGLNNNSPQFRKLTLRCWLRGPEEFGTEPDEGEASYSIDLRHDASLWDLGPANGVHDYWPPHDGRMVRFTLEPTGDPQRPIHISAASVLDEALGLRHYIVPNGFLTLDRD